MKETIWAILAGTLVIAIIFVLVRPYPGGKTPVIDAINGITGALEASISLAIHGTNEENASNSGSKQNG